MKHQNLTRQRYWKDSHKERPYSGVRSKKNLLCSPGTEFAANRKRKQLRKWSSGVGLEWHQAAELLCFKPNFQGTHFKNYIFFTENDVCIFKTALKKTHKTTFSTWTMASVKLIHQTRSLGLTDWLNIWPTFTEYVFSAAAVYFQSTT